MVNSWEAVFSELSEFIEKRPDIIIDKNRVRIPDDIRPEFNLLFDNLRDAFLKRNASSLLEQSEKLCKNYIKIEEEVIQLLNLEKVTMMPGLSRFLHDPANQLRRGLYEPTFDLMKGKIDEKTFALLSSRIINESFNMMYQLGYEKWIAMSLIKMLEADEILRVVMPEFTLYDAHKSGGMKKDNVPDPEHKKSITFEYEGNVQCNIADFIIHPSKQNKYVSVRSQFGASFSTAANASEKREWLPVNLVPPLKEGLMLVYQGERAVDISLVSDEKRICRPDILILCKPFEECYKRGGVAEIQAYHTGYKPVLGTFVISIDQLSELKSEKRLEGINILGAGLDSGNLITIINALSGSQ